MHRFEHRRSSGQSRRDRDASARPRLARARRMAERDVRYSFSLVVTWSPGASSGIATACQRSPWRSALAQSIRPRSAFPSVATPQVIPRRFVGRRVGAPPTPPRRLWHVDLLATLLAPWIGALKVVRGAVVPMVETHVAAEAAAWTLPWVPSAEHSVPPDARAEQKRAPPRPSWTALDIDHKPAPVRCHRPPAQCFTV